MMPLPEGKLTRRGRRERNNMQREWDRLPDEEKREVVKFLALCRAKIRLLAGDPLTDVIADTWDDGFNNGRWYWRAH